MIDITEIIGALRDTPIYLIFIFGGIWGLLKIIEKLIERLNVKYAISLALVLVTLGLVIYFVDPSKPNITMKDAVKKYIVYHNNDNNKKAWQMIQANFISTILNNNEFSYIQNENDAFDYYQNFWEEHPAIFELGLVDQEKNIAVIIIKYINTGQTQKNKYRFKKINIKNDFNGWIIDQTIERKKII